MEKEKKEPRLSDEVVKLQKHRIMLWCAIIIIAFFLIVQFTVANCGNKILADQFTFASTISSIILSVIAIIMSVVSGESINNLLHKFRDVHDEISDVPGKIDSSIQKMDNASSKFEGIYDNLKETPQKIKESTEVMKEISKHVDDSVESLSNLMKEIQNKTENWHLLRDDLKEIKEGFQNMAFTSDVRDENDNNDLSKKQAKSIFESGSLFGSLLLYTVKLAKDKGRYFSLNGFTSLVAEEEYKRYFHGYFIALRSTGIITVKELSEDIAGRKFEILKYNRGLDSLKEFLEEKADGNERLKNLIPVVEKFIDEADGVTSTTE